MPTEKLATNTLIDQCKRHFLLAKRLCNKPLFQHPYPPDYSKKETEIFDPGRLERFRDGSPDALIGSNTTPELVKPNGDLDPEIYQADLKVLNAQWKYAKKRLPPQIAEKLTDNLIGSPITFDLEPNRIVTEFLCRHLYYFSQIHNLLPPFFIQDKVLFELGAGFGGLCRLFITHMKPKTTLIIDLPTSLILEEYFLSQTFPDLSIATASTLAPFYKKKIRIPFPLLTQFDIVLLPPPFLPLLPDNSVDLTINTHSLMEMFIPQINFYYDHIKRLCTGYFYQCNRWPHKFDPHYTAKDWPINGWEVLYRDTQLGMKYMVELLLKKPNGQ